MDVIILYSSDFYGMGMWKQEKHRILAGKHFGKWEMRTSEGLHALTGMKLIPSFK